MSSPLPTGARATPLSHARAAPAARVWLALALANARYWPTVAPVVRERLAFWERRAQTIGDPRARSLALGKLREERFNPRLAATLATLAPRARRRGVTEAIVALQVHYDYLDALTEQPDIAAEESERLYRDFIDSVSAGGQPHAADPYLRELAGAVEERLAPLPGAAAVSSVARRAAERCARAQVLGHQAARGGARRLERWAREQAGEGAPRWPEWLAGAQASVLCLHALIAAAADPRTTRRDAEGLDALYLLLGALTMLDTLVDRGEDGGAAELDYIDFYESPEQMGARLAEVALQARDVARDLPHAEHHVMTLTGIVAYYASARGARDPSVRAVFEHVSAELRPAIVPTLAVMCAWRGATRIRLRVAPSHMTGEGAC